MLAVIDRLGSILFIVVALILGPILLLALWTHALLLELWHWLNKPATASGRPGDQQRARLSPFQCNPIERSR